MRPRTLIAFFAFAIGIQLPNPGGAASLTTQEGASHPALDNDYRLGVALELPAAEAHRRQYEYLASRAVTMTSGDIPSGEMLVAVPLGGISRGDLIALGAELPAGVRIAEFMVSFPGNLKTTTTTGVVRDGQTLEEALTVWRRLVENSVRENVAIHPVSLEHREQSQLLHGLEPSDAQEVLSRGAGYVTEANQILASLDEGVFLVVGIGVDAQPEAWAAAIEYLRTAGFGLGTARSLATLPLLPPDDPVRDRSIAEMRDAGTLPSQQADRESAQGISNLMAQYSYEEHISRYGVMTWTPRYVDPDFFYDSPSDTRFLEADLAFGSAFRVSGHDPFYCAFGTCVYASYEFDFDLTDDWGHGYRGGPGFFICDLPVPCVQELLVVEGGGIDWTNYGVVTGNAAAIAASGYYNVEIGLVPGSVVYPVEVQLRSVAGAISTECPYWENGAPEPEFCSFENYGHMYNKERSEPAPAGPSEHVITSGSGNSYGAYYGGSYITDNTFSPCPGQWGFSAGNVDYWCWSSTNGPEPPGRVTIQPKSGFSFGYAYRTVPFAIYGADLVGDPDNFSVEYVVQCLTGNPCEGKLGWEGRDGGNPTEAHTGVVFTIPNDGWYYLCRYDSRHGDTPAIYSHSNLRALLFNHEPGTQLRIDAMAIFGWVGYHDGFISTVDSNTCNPVAQGT